MTSWAALAAKVPVKAAPVVADTQEKPRVAVIDANAIINGSGLLELMRVADKVVTVPDVLKEIRDKQSRSALASLPFTIQTQEPSEESIRAVVKFARATGDLHALSATDTRLLALAHTIEVSYYGSDHLRDVPAPPKLKKKRAIDSKTLPGWGSQGGEWAELDRLNEEEEEAAAAVLSTSRISTGIQQLTLDDPTNSILHGNDHDGDDVESTEEHPIEEEDDDEEEDNGGEWEVALKTKNKERRARRRAYRFAEREQQRQEEHSDSDDDVEEGNEEDADAMVDETDSTSPPHTLNEPSHVCSITADFPMQNVLLQMGLRLVAPDGRQISTVNRWVLRCTACMQITKEVGRIFCPRCGNATLDRVQVRVGYDGTEQYGVKKKHILRGTKFSLPRPKGGRSAAPILREDQLLTKKHLLRAKKAAEAAKNGESLDPFAPEYTADTWHQAAVLNGVGQSASALLMTSWKTNPNERKHVATNRRRK